MSGDTTPGTDTLDVDIIGHDETDVAAFFYFVMRFHAISVESIGVGTTRMAWRVSRSPVVGGLPTAPAPVVGRSPDRTTSETFGPAGGAVRSAQEITSA